ncbi:MAG: DUF4342 domain-containing protein [Eubacterium sp.]|nr:DUF4342 domain-containing protein [Eubacterium sp.]
MDSNQILANLRNAFNNILRYRITVTSAEEKVADLPLLVVIVAALMVPKACVVAAVAALATQHHFRMEKDLEVRY